MTKPAGHRHRIEHEAWIVLADGRKALFLRNEGDADYPVLQVEEVLTRTDRSTHEEGVDRPTRVHESVTGLRHAIEQTDWHQLAEDAFARRTCDALGELVASRPIRQLVIVAPPRTLAILRHSYPPAVRKLISIEIDKDLTNRPVYEIEDILFDHA